MTHLPRISVVIPCFNYARYVGQAIECALSQTYANKEVVVVNDGSSDDSLEVIARYLDQIALIDQPNQGSIAAYSNGFAATSGEIVIFLDADDLLEPDALARVAEVWTPACAKVQYDLRIIDGEGRDLGRRFCNFGDGYDAAHVRAMFRRTGTYRWPVTVGNAYSRWFVDALLPLHVDHGPDGALNTVAPVYGDVATIAEPLGRYRIHGANMWSNDGADPSRLPYRIQHRRNEEALMRRHAAARGVAVPDESLLDHELAFINYRLLAHKLDLPYEGDDRDSTLALLQRALLALGHERLPLPVSLAHLLWFGTLALAPKPAARGLYSLRFKRSALIGGWKRRLRARALSAVAP